MCGIVALIKNHKSSLRARQVKAGIEKLMIVSESRGVEASGIAMKCGDRVVSRKSPMRASKFVRSADFLEFFAPSTISEVGISILGHSRLVTNGEAVVNSNNQPVTAGSVTAVHNGIIVNSDKLWCRFPRLARTTELDSEIAAALVEMFLVSRSPVRAVQSLYQEIEGEASLGLLFQFEPRVVFATNTGSLFYALADDQSTFILASESRLLRRACSSGVLATIFPNVEVQQVPSHSGIEVNCDTLEITPFEVKHRPFLEPRTQVLPTASYRQADREVINHTLRRCSRCILPETFPSITFDEEGVCSLCRTFQPYPLNNVEELVKLLTKAAKRNTKIPSLVALSGGRDSCFGLHYLKTALGVNPIAFTYDWGMVTDLARRNMSRMCGRLGVEHIIVSADIEMKRNNVRKSIQAWLKKPDLGMVPLFMAGDKQFYFFANQLVRDLKIPLMIFCENQRFEKTRFKSAFCGVEEGSRRLFNLHISEKAKLASYFVSQVLRNPAYCNSSLLDGLLGFGSAYLLKHDYLFLFDYVPWDERLVESTLISEYDWEMAEDSPSSWRIGDGSAAFYNYIYYSVAGFTEYDTFRSNQIREGVITRDDALTLVAAENKPRWKALEWYFKVLKLDLKATLAAVDGIPKLYK